MSGVELQTPLLVGNGNGGSDQPPPLPPPPPYSAEAGQLYGSVASIMQLLQYCKPVRPTP